MAVANAGANAPYRGKLMLGMGKEEGDTPAAGGVSGESQRKRVDK